MPAGEFLKTATAVKTPLALAAFSIAALLSVYTSFSKKRTPTAKRSLWMVIVAICALAFAPIMLDAYLKLQDNRLIYHIHVIALDERDVPVDEANVKSSSSGIAYTGGDGSCELEVAKAAVESRKLVIFAQKEDLFGQATLPLDTDANPSVSIRMKKDRTAGLQGVVEDDEGQLLSGVLIVLSASQSALTTKQGIFNFAPFTTPGSQVKVHAEKEGYLPLDGYYPAGEKRITIQLEKHSGAK